MENKIILGYDNLGIPLSWFHFPDSFDDSDFQIAINLFESNIEKEIGINFKYDKNSYKIFENVKKYHVFFFPIFKNETLNEKKIKILSAMVVLWLYIIDDYYENNITKDNSNEMVIENLKLTNILIKPNNQIKNEKLSINEIITKAIKKQAFEIIKDENSIIYNNFISSIYQFISSSVAYYTLNNPSYATYAELRVCNSGVLMLESTYLIYFSNLKNELSGCDSIDYHDLIFLNDSRYSRLKWIQCMIICIHNDLFSSDDEKDTQQHVNSFWIEYNKNNGNVSTTLQSLNKKVENYVNEFCLLEESLLKSYSNNNSILLMMIKALKYTISGNITLSINTNKYKPKLFEKTNEINPIYLKN